MTMVKYWHTLKRMQGRQMPFWHRGTCTCTIQLTPILHLSKLMFLIDVFSWIMPLPHTVRPGNPWDWVGDWGEGQRNIRDLKVQMMQIARPPKKFNCVTESRNSLHGC